MLKVCPEVKVYAAYQLLQFLFFISMFGWAVVKKMIHVGFFISLLGWLTVLYLLCKNDRRNWAWWFVAISVAMGLAIDVFIAFSPLLRKQIKERV